MQLNYEITGAFNYQLTKKTGFVRLWDDDTGSLVKAFSESEITVVGNTFTIDTSSIVFEKHKYHITIDYGLFENDLGCSFEITNSTDWAFEVADGDWLSTDWLSTDFLIN